MNSLLLSKEFVSALVDVLTLAVTHNQLEDAESVLTAVRGLRPKMPELATFDAWIAMKRSLWAEAIRHLHQVDAAASNWWIGKALLAFCQFATDDPTWNASANEVELNSGSPEAIALVHLLLHPEEVENPSAEVAEVQPATPPTQPLIGHGVYLRG